MRWNGVVEAFGADKKVHAERSFTDVVTNDDPLVLWFLIDQSGSISQADFDLSINFVMALLKKVFKTYYNYLQDGEKWIIFKNICTSSCVTVLYQTPLK